MQKCKINLEENSSFTWIHNLGSIYIYCTCVYLRRQNQEKVKENMIQLFFDVPKPVSYLWRQ